MIWIVVIGFASGIISGMGIGGGTILIPALIFLLHLNQHQAQGVNLIYFIPTAIVALITHTKNKNVLWKTTKPLAILGLAGAAAGSFLAVSMDADLLRKIFGGFLFFMGLSEVFKKKTKKEGYESMNKEEFSKLKLKFIQADLNEKIAIYTQTPGLTTPQYKELLQHYPYDQISKLETALQ